MNTPKVLVIGTGISGILCGTLLKHQVGLNTFDMLEKDPAGVGGVWRKQKYPGLSCDIPSGFYSYSFEKWPHWTRDYPSALEIHPYLVHCVQKYGLQPHIQYNTEVLELHWDENKEVWNTSLKVNGQPQQREYNFVFNSSGVFTQPFTPEFPGRDDKFKGKQVHASAWEDIDLTGKKVALVGTGPTAIQIVPEIVHKVANLTIYQRTPNWIIPMDNKPFDEKKRNEFLNNPEKLRAYRQQLMDQTERMWGVISVPRSSSARKIEERCIDHLKNTLKDPELVKKLTPDYPIGCKRICFDPGFVPCLNRDNVELVTDGIGSATEKGIVSRVGKEREHDVIIYATGWGAFSMGRSFPIYGKGGVELWDHWLKVGVPRAYQGAMVNGYPNLFLCVGPNSQVWSSFVEVMEMKTDLLMKLLKHMCATNAASFEPRVDLEEKWAQFCMDNLPNTPYAAGCLSYYKYQKSSPRVNGKADQMDPNETNYYPAWFPGLPSELREASDKSGPADYVWTTKKDGKWDLPIPPTVTPYKEDRMRATPMKKRTGGGSNEARL